MLGFDGDTADAAAERAAIRQAWGCDCEGDATAPPESSHYHGMIKRVKDEIEHITGYQPPTCPWRALEIPLVRDVINAHAFMESGQLREFWGDDPPRLLVDGVRLHDTAIRLTDQADREARRKRHEAARAAQQRMGHIRPRR